MWLMCHVELLRRPWIYSTHFLNKRYSFWNINYIYISQIAVSFAYFLSSSDFIGFIIGTARQQASKAKQSSKQAKQTPPQQKNSTSANFRGKLRCVSSDIMNITHTTKDCAVIVDRIVFRWRLSVDNYLFILLLSFTQGNIFSVMKHMTTGLHVGNP